MTAPSFGRLGGGWQPGRASARPLAAPARGGRARRPRRGWRRGTRAAAAPHPTALTAPSFQKRATLHMMMCAHRLSASDLEQALHHMREHTVVTAASSGLRSFTSNTTHCLSAELAAVAGSCHSARLEHGACGGVGTGCQGAPWSAAPRCSRACWCRAGTRFSRARPTPAAAPRRTSWPLAFSLP